MKMNRCAMVVGVMVIASSGRAQSLYQSNEAPAEQPPANRSFTLPMNWYGGGSLRNSVGHRRLRVRPRCGHSCPR